MDFSGIRIFENKLVVEVAYEKANMGCIRLTQEQSASRKIVQRQSRYQNIIALHEAFLDRQCDLLQVLQQPSTRAEFKRPTSMDAVATRLLSPGQLPESQEIALEFWKVAVTFIYLRLEKQSLNKGVLWRYDGGGDHSNISRNSARVLLFDDLFD